jgi:hypothetical protein
MSNSSRPSLRGSRRWSPLSPGLLVFGRDVDEVLERVRAAIAVHVGRGPLPIRLAVSRQDRGELCSASSSATCSLAITWQKACGVVWIPNALRSA